MTYLLKLETQKVNYNMEFIKDAISFKEYDRKLLMDERVFRIRGNNNL